MATQPIHKEHENRQPFADTLADIENREFDENHPDWEEVQAGYKRWLDSRGETMQ